jgi:hypothetical protein
MKKILAALVFVFAFVYPTWASEWKEWPEKTNVPVDKVWTISFNQGIEKMSINNDNVYITSSADQVVKLPATITLAEDKKITIDANSDYQPGQKYILFISNIRSTEGTILKDPIKMPFTIAAGETTTFNGSGSVNMAGTAIPDVTMTFERVSGTGATPGSVTTDNNGSWSQIGFAIG